MICVDYILFVDSTSYYQVISFRLTNKMFELVRIIW